MASNIWPVIFLSIFRDMDFETVFFSNKLLCECGEPLPALKKKRICNEMIQGQLGCFLSHVPIADITHSETRIFTLSNETCVNCLAVVRPITHRLSLFSIILIVWKVPVSLFCPVWSVHEALNNRLPPCSLCQSPVSRGHPGPTPGGTGGNGGEDGTCYKGWEGLRSGQKG